MKNKNIYKELKSKGVKPTIDSLAVDVCVLTKVIKQLTEVLGYEVYIFGNETVLVKKRKKNEKESLFISQKDR